MSSASRLDTKGRDDLERMRGAAKRMSQMFEQLRELSRIAAEEGSFEPIRLKEVVNQAIRDLDFRIAETKAVVKSEELPAVRANKTQMLQLFQNLIGNALKFHRRDAPPQIMIQGRVLDKEFVEISVQDNGIGFDEKYGDQIFKPFRKLHSAGEYEGSGIGLAICQKIVMHHGGKITAKSSPGKGSNFIFTLSQV